VRCYRWRQFLLSWLLGGAALVGGCGRAIVGSWRAAEATPSRLVFCIDEASFGRDGTYTATTTIEGKTLQERGRYSFNGYKLVLQPREGGRRQYNAVLKLNRLEITDRDRKVVLRKVR
jgi:hypothetical protein